MRTNAPLAVVVALALAGGLAAFLLATPDQGRRPSGAALGFQQLSREFVQASANHAATHHRSEHRMLLTRRDATRVGRDWLGAIAGSANRRNALPDGVRLAPVDEPARRRVTAFVRWADDLPATSWTASSGVAKLTGPSAADAAPEVDGEPASWTVTGSVEVRIAQSATRVRRQQVPVTMRLVPVLPAGATMPRGWVIRDITTGGGASRFVRAYADPVLVHRATVDVVAPATHRTLAASIADDAGRVLPALVTRYRRLAGAGVATIWVLEGPSRARRVLGQGVPIATTTADAGEMHGTVWVDDRGDVVVDASRMNRLGEGERTRAVRHALAHVASRSLDDDAPAVLREGVALMEEQPGTAAELFARVDFAPLVDAFGRAESGLATLLVADPDRDLVAGEASTDHLAALATVAWIEHERGHDVLVRLLGQIDSGVDPERALRQVVRLDARGVEVAVARWTRAAGQPAEDDSDDAPAGGGVEDDQPAEAP